MANLGVRLRRGLGVGLLTGFWAWIATAVHGWWSFGLVLGYLDGGTVPLYPDFPVTYETFLNLAIFAGLFPLVMIPPLYVVIARRWRLLLVLAGWTLGAAIGANGVSFAFQIDFGTTWAPLEALRTLFLHPIVTPLWLILGWVGTSILTRPLRLKDD